MKRILVYGMTDNRGGIESYLMNYYKLLVESELIFDFITEHRPIAYKEEIEQLSGRIFYIPSRRDGIFEHMRAVRKILIEHKEYDTIYFNILSASEVFTVLGAFGIKGVRKIVHSHNNNVKSIGRHRVLRPLLNFLSDVKLACSNEAGQFMFGNKSIKNNEVIIIKNAIDVSKFEYSQRIRENVRKEFNLQPGDLVVGHVGRLCHQKNTTFLLDIFSHIYKNNKNAYLMLVGDGEDRENVKNVIKQHDMNNHVLMLGMREDVEKLMQAMDVFLLPSRFEGLGIVLIEAQASGLPCFTSNKVVPKAVAVTDLVNFIDLERTSEEWARQIIITKMDKRISQSEIVRSAGYDVNTEVEKIKKILER